MLQAVTAVQVAAGPKHDEYRPNLPFQKF